MAGFRVLQAKSDTVFLKNGVCEFAGGGLV